MFGTQSKRDLPLEFQSQIPILRPSIHARRANLTVKFQDLYGFTVEGNVDDVNVLNEVREKVRQQGREWWSLEANKGANWYLQTTEVKVTPATKHIGHDLPRTFPGHPWLDTPEGHAALRRVLVGYSFRDSDVGYCQGLNYVAALLLLVMKTEEDAFWMLAVLLENVLVNDCYTNNLSGCHVEQRVVKEFLDKKCPRIAAHLEAMEFDVSLVATEWVWDVLFYEGAKVLFHVALAIFKMKEDQLLITHHVGDVISILQRTTHDLFDPDELLTVAFDKIGSMTTNTISKQRKKQEPAVMKELDQRIRRLNSLKLDEK
ncbi:hypothetical protein C1H46_039591 [Malus baccata]|uniref:Rab-GAP TBC domain-containing protein n=1 Tax=Malus baccata TaxID=106549 RepID=A0A540KKZ1_MALBA|nr:hypothetical protein C1H46_039591 [Malus baccata]